MHTKIVYDWFSDKMAFDGIDIHMNVPVTVVFNESRQVFKGGILMWNRFLRKWMHSEDAGLSWTPYTNLCDDLLRRSSIMLDFHIYPQSEWPPGFS